MAHNYIFDGVVGWDASFICSICGGPLNFNLPGVGEPCTIDNGDGTFDIVVTRRQVKYRDITGLKVEVTGESNIR